MSKGDTYRYQLLVKLSLDPFYHVSLSQFLDLKSIVTFRERDYVEKPFTRNSHTFVEEDVNSKSAF